MSGGGSLGVYQVGALKVLTQKRSHYDVISGISIGALNGSIIAMYHKGLEEEEGVVDLENLWIKMKPIYIWKNGDVMWCSVVD